MTAVAWLKPQLKVNVLASPPRWRILFAFVHGAVSRNSLCSCSANRHLGKMHPIPAPGQRPHSYSLSFDMPGSIGCPPHVALQLLQCCGLPVQRHLPMHIVYDCLDDPLQLLFPTSTLQRDRHSPVQAGVLLSLEIIHDKKEVREEVEQSQHLNLGKGSNTCINTPLCRTQLQLLFI